MKIDIVGGSLGGLSSAISLKKQDPTVEVIVHEKYKTIGYNHEGRRCGEAHTVEREWEKWKPEHNSIFQTITKGEFTIGNKHYSASGPPGSAFILNRQEFICQLAREARSLGVVIQTNVRITALNQLDGDYIVDASGCPSTIKRILGFPMGYVGATYQQTLEEANCFVADTLQLVFTSDCGYFWVFPRNPQKREVNIGIGLFGDFKYDLRKMLEAFKEKQGITGTINYVTGGLIPIGLQPPFRHRNILFVGDAGVGTFPFSGQGIYRALLSGDIAGRCLARRRPGHYPTIIRREFLLWQLIGSFFIKTNLVLRHINPGFFLVTFNALERVSKRFASLTY